MSVVTGYGIGDRICEALGIDPRTVTAIDIHIDPTHPVTVYVRHEPELGEVAALAPILGRYELHTRGEEPVAAGRGGA